MADHTEFWVAAAAAAPIIALATQVAVTQTLGPASFFLQARLDKGRPRYHDCPVS